MPTRPFLCIVLFLFTLPKTAPAQTKKEQAVLHLLALGLYQNKLPVELLNHKEGMPPTVVVFSPEKYELTRGVSLHTDTISLVVATVTMIFEMNYYFAVTKKVRLKKDMATFQFATSSYGMKKNRHSKGTMKGQLRGGEWKLIDCTFSDAENDPTMLRTMRRDARRQTRRR